MRRLRYLLLTAALVVGLSTLGVAQDNDGGGRDGRKHRRHHAGKLAEKLGLTDAQRTQLQSINEQHREQVRAIAQNDSLTEEQKREQLRAVNQQHQEQIQGILTPEQQQRFRELRERRRDRREDVRDRREDRRDGREDIRDRREDRRDRNDGRFRPRGQRRFR
jgi:Spy/CpxP family protein refolding chaperone